MTRSNVEQDALEEKKKRRKKRVKRKKAGTSRSKKDSTISPQAYANMQAGFPKKKKKNPLDL